MFQKPNVQYVMTIASDAGHIIMSHRGKVDPTRKADNSFVTKADLEASRFIMKKLQALTPDIPVVSEEEPLSDNRKIVANNETFWMIDPLDGTNSFIDGHDGFGVHIALIHKGNPVMGVVYFPAAEEGRGKMYYTGNNGKAYSKVNGKTPEPLQVIPSVKSVITIKGAFGWRQEQDIKSFGRYRVKPVRAVGGGRLCVTAEGNAHIACFPKPMSYWDVAAGHAILKAAGGDLYAGKTGRPLKYTDNPYLAVMSCYGAHANIYQACLKPNFLRRYMSRPK
jgi:3'(2'), 5'-bisphosphate nucleotidase